MKLSNNVKTMVVSAVALSTSTEKVRSICIQAAPGNAGVVEVGGASLTTGLGIALSASVAVTITYADDRISPADFKGIGATTDAVTIFTVAGA